MDLRAVKGLIAAKYLVSTSCKLDQFPPKVNDVKRLDAIIVLP
jgi:hypothetical protein